MTIDPIAFTALVTLVGGVITYLLTELKRVRRENWQLLQSIYENREAMEGYAAMRRARGDEA